MTVHRPHDILCPSWEPASTTPGSKACRYYIKPQSSGATAVTPDGEVVDLPVEKQEPIPAGLCMLPTEMLCVEWVRRNGTIDQQKALRVLPPSPAPPPASPQPKRAMLRTPFGQADVALPESFRPAKEIDPDRLQELEMAGVEVEMDAPYLRGGRHLAIVPKRTGRADRDEITFREAATLRLIIDAFPGAKVVDYKAGPDGGHSNGVSFTVYDERPFTDYPLTGKRCSECKESQRMTPGGQSCVNGHGGAEPIDETDTVKEEDPLT